MSIKYNWWRRIFGGDRDAREGIVVDPCGFQWKAMSKLRHAAGLAEQRTAPFCHEAGLTTMQLNILLTLHYAGPQTISGLARQSSMARANNSALCKRLEQEGLVLRARAAGDERQVVVSLTPQGAETVRAFSRRCAQSTQNDRVKISRQETEEILSALDKLLEILDNTTGGIK